jgi:hypothetical protein
MLYIVVHPRVRPVEQQINLLFTTLTMAGIKYTIATVEEIPVGATVITDCFVMETPIGDPGHDIAQQLIELASGNDNRLIFYYPSECEATLGASFNPTGRLLKEKQVLGYLIKNGDKDIAGFVKNYNFHEFFAWVLVSDFNLARLARTQRLIDTETKTHKFLFLNGEQRGMRDYLYGLVKSAGLLEDSIWSYRGGKSATGLGPAEDWLDPFVHYDFRFFAYYPGHFYLTDVGIVSETSQEEFFPTEKVYKSLMLGHPFIVYGGPNYLSKLHKMGFKTFSDWIDESYDQALWPTERGDAVAKSMVSCKPNVTQESVVIRQHNRQHFFTVANGIYDHLLEVLQDIDKRVIINEQFDVTETTIQRYFLN